MSDFIYRPQIEVLSAADGIRRRQWSDEDKLRIVEESFVGHRQVTATARRHEICRSLLTIWRRQYRNGELGASRLVSAAFERRRHARDHNSAPTPGNRLDRSVQNTEKRPPRPEADPAACLEPIKTARLPDRGFHPERKTLDLTSSSGDLDVKR